MPFIYTRTVQKSAESCPGGELWKPAAGVIVAVSVVITPSPCEHRDLLKMQKQNLSFSCDNVVVATKEKLKLLKLA